MSSPQSLSDRVARLRQRNNTNRSGSIPSVEPNPGDWGPGRLAFPASYSQSRLWFLQQLEPDLAAYHLPALPHYQQSCPPCSTDPPGGQTMSDAIALRPRAAG